MATPLGRRLYIKRCLPGGLTILALPASGLNGLYPPRWLARSTCDPLNTLGTISASRGFAGIVWLPGGDLKLRPSGYELEPPSHTLMKGYRSPGVVSLPVTASRRRPQAATGCGTDAASLAPVWRQGRRWHPVRPGSAGLLTSIMIRIRTYIAAVSFRRLRQTKATVL
jgi:hypothetical protein